MKGRVSVRMKNHQIVGVSMCLRYPLKFLRSIISNSEVAADPSKWASIDEEAYREAVENNKALLLTAIMLNEMDDPAACERALRAAAYFGVPIIQACAINMKCMAIFRMMRMTSLRCLRMTIPIY